MITYDVATKVLDSEIFPQHPIADIISGITFIVLFSQEMSYTHTYTRTRTHAHTHTHTHTHTLKNQKSLKTRAETSFTPYIILTR